MKRLLMIDDDEKLVALVREYLEPHGFEVAAAHDGDAGVEAALSTEPSLVILDLMLPTASRSVGGCARRAGCPYGGVRSPSRSGP